MTAISFVYLLASVWHLVGLDDSKSYAKLMIFVFLWKITQYHVFIKEKLFLTVLFVAQELYF